jgi:hypothetical protein
VPFPAISLATGLVSELSDGRLAVLEGSSGAPYLGDMAEVVRAVDGFLAEIEGAAYPDASRNARSKSFA